MKKIIKLSLFFAAVAAGNFAQAVVIAGQPQQASSSPSGVHDMVSLATSTVSDVASTAVDAASKVGKTVAHALQVPMPPAPPAPSSAASSTSTSAPSHFGGFFSAIEHSVDTAVAQAKKTMDSASQHVGSSTKASMIGTFLDSAVSSIKKHFAPQEVNAILHKTIKKLTGFLHAGVEAHTASSSSSSSHMMPMTTAVPASDAVPALSSSDSVKVQALMGSNSSTYAPVQFTNSSGQKGNYWENTSSQTGLGRAQINGKNYEAVVEFNAPSSAHRGSIGPAYTWAYNTDQQAAISSMKLDIRNARTIGTIHIQTHTQAEIDAAKAQLIRNNTSMVLDTAKIEENKKLNKIINGTTKSLLGIEVVSAPKAPRHSTTKAPASGSSSTSTSDSSHMMTLTKPASTSASNAVAAKAPTSSSSSASTSDSSHMMTLTKPASTSVSNAVVATASDAVPAVPAIPTMPSIALPSKKDSSSS